MGNTVKIHLFCAGCGNEVEVSAESPVNIWRIEPCGKCLEAAKSEGHEEGHQEGYEEAEKENANAE